jgi:hypothetical protein
MITEILSDGYTTPDFIKEIGDIGVIAIAVAAVIGLIMTISKTAIWFDHRRDDAFAKRVDVLIDPKLAKLYKFVGDRTVPIQPGENGGESLSDVNAKVDKHITDWDTRFSAIEAKLGIKDRRVTADQIPDIQ